MAKLVYQKYRLSTLKTWKQRAIHKILAQNEIAPIAPLAYHNTIYASIVINDISISLTEFLSQIEHEIRCELEPKDKEMHLMHRLQAVEAQLENIKNEINDTLLRVYSERR